MRCECTRQTKCWSVCASKGKAISAKIEFTDRALEEIEKAQRWWLDNREKAPEAFEEDLADGLGILKRNPLAGKEVSRTRYRCLTLPRIRYYLYYRLVDDSAVEILSVWHTSRNAPDL